MTQTVRNSVDISIIAQIITGAVGIDGLFKKLEPMHSILQDVLGFEILVQAIELLYYIFIIRTSTLENMASIRYFDWVITTPVMLITTVVYFTYERYLENYNNAQTEIEKKEFKNKLENLKFFKFIKENKTNIFLIIVCNFFMLFFGYLGEIKYDNIYTAFSFGTAFFLMSFYIIYDNYARFSKIGNNMFKLLFTVWATYGVAFLLNPVYKNILFNYLDVVAKNFFGLYLYFKIIQKS